MPGWLVVVLLRHVLALDELTDEESTELGPLLARVTAGLRDVTGCTKTYVLLFAEAKGFGHVHFHVVPRMSWFADDQKGPNVFTFLRQSEADWVPEDARDEVALSIRRALGDA